MDIVEQIGDNSTLDVLAGARRRRETAMRSTPTESGDRDPAFPGSRYHRGSTGLAGDYFQYGFARGAIDVLRELWPWLDDAARARATELAARYQGRVA
ncbi:hypothetical protein [Mycobacterium colombiense]|uniref:hypothetical protein n=1 Tax=Mycobacterium colombiense TaxID=339268 RepID=UPI0012DB07E9|nr:hypothetical protein [Mycobacterium colombiense]